MFEELSNEELMEIDGGFIPAIIGCIGAGVAIGQCVGGLVRHYWG